MAAVSQAEASAAVAAEASNHEETIFRRCAAPEMEVLEHKRMVMAEDFASGNGRNRVSRLPFHSQVT